MHSALVSNAPIPNSDRANRESNISKQDIPKKQKSSLWKKITQFGLIISIIAAIVAVLSYLGITPKSGTGNHIALIYFEQSPPFVDRALLGNAQIPGYFFQVRIFNESYEDSIHVKSWKLTDLRELNNSGVFRPWENAVPAILEWPAFTSKEISPRENVFVPFARIFPPEIQKVTDTLLSGNIEIPQLRFCVSRWDRRMTSHVPPGTHRFKLTVYFEKNPPVEAKFQLEWSGEQRENLDLMASDIKIKQIDKAKGCALKR